MSGRRSLEFAAGIKPSLHQLAGGGEPIQHATSIQLEGGKHHVVCGRCGPVSGQYDSPGEAVIGAMHHQQNQRLSAHHDPYDDDWD